MSSRLWMGAAVLFALVLILSMLSGTGSNPPGARDKDRLSDLRELSGFVLCATEHNEGKAPLTLTPLDKCGMKTRFVDPFTETPYSYEVLDDTTFRICAGFENAKSLPDHWFGVGTFDTTTGCATVPFASES